jgi:hypothetical protein
MTAFLSIRYNAGWTPSAIHAGNRIEKRQHIVEHGRAAKIDPAQRAGDLSVPP